MAKLSEAQKRADAKWRENNKDHANYLRARSAAKSFIKNRATEEDLAELLKLISDRKQVLNDK